MLPAAAGEQKRGVHPVPLTAFPAPRQGDSRPLHPPFEITQKAATIDKSVDSIYSL